MTAIPAVLALLIASIGLMTDLRTRRIPNWLTVGALIGGLLVNLLLGGSQGVVSALAGAGLGFVLLIPFYAVRAMGAGDVKLLAALGALLGPQTLLVAAAAGALVGGLMSLIILARRGRLALAVHQMFVMHTIPTPSGAKAPYAVAIASGVYVAVLKSWQLFPIAN
jgi:prepilin peptidase CpaA